MDEFTVTVQHKFYYQMDIMAVYILEVTFHLAQNPMTGGFNSPTTQNQTKKSSTTRLQELKKLRDDGLISEDLYEKKQAAILEESN